MTAQRTGTTKRRERVERLRRRALLRDVIVFQGKLLVDALKDVLLSPLSLAGAAIDMLDPPRRGAGYFESVMRTGRGLERRIDLFGSRGGRTATADWTVDELVSRFESSLREQAGETGAGEAARRALERTLAGLRKDGEHER